MNPLDTIIEHLKEKRIHLINRFNQTIEQSFEIIQNSFNLENRSLSFISKTTQKLLGRITQWRIT